MGKTLQRNNQIIICLKLFIKIIKTVMNMKSNKQVIVLIFIILISILIMGCVSQPYTGLDENVDSYSGETYNKTTENDFIFANEIPQSYFKASCDTFTYSNIRRFVMNEYTTPPESAVNIEGMINYFSYNCNEAENGEKFGTSFEVGNAPWNSEHKLLKMTIKTKEIDMTEAPAINVVFLLDISGSMAEEKKLEYVKSSINIAVESLREKDKISIVTFSNITSVLLSSVSGSEKNKIREVINKIRASGSTDGVSGINKAYSVAKENYIQNGNNRVIITTDGDFNVNESSDTFVKELIQEKRADGIYLTALGYGTGNLKCSKLESMAKNGNGNMYYIDNIFEVEKVFKKDFGKTIFTSAKDVKIETEFNSEIVESYRLIGYDSEGLSSDEFQDSSTDSSEMGAGSSCTAFYEIVTVKEIKDKDKNICKVTIKYKEPDDFLINGKSKSLIKSVNYLKNLKEDSLLSEDFKFASAVAEFGLILRNSEYKGSATYENVINRAKESIGESEDMSRIEFVKIVEQARDIKKY